MRIDPFRNHVMGQFQALADFIRHSEAQLQESHHTNKALTITELGTGPHPDEDFEKYCEHSYRSNVELSDCDWRYQFAFARLMRYSHITLTFTLMESNLSRIAQELVKQKELRLDLEDLQAKDLVRRFEKFWSKVAGLEWWEDKRRSLLNDIQQLRNCIVHRNGVARDNESELLARLGVGQVRPGSEIGWLRIPDPDVGSVLLDKDFCGEKVEQMIGLLTEIFDRARCFDPAQPIDDAP